MRDLLITAIIFGSIPFILRRPVVGVLFWVWIGLMNPHRLAWGFAYSFPFAQVVAVATLAGLLFTREPREWKGGAAPWLLLAFLLWTVVTTIFALEPDRAQEMAIRVWKIQLFTFLALLTLHKREHVLWLAGVVAFSIGYYSIKGGLFTILTGGAHRVYGPAESFINENNSLALATITIIPLFAFLYTQANKKLVKVGLGAAILLSAAAALGSYSRGGLLAIGAMTVFLWMKGKQKILLGAALITAGLGLVAFMPSSWEDRMSSIGDYQEDASAQGRINTWIMLSRIALDRPLVGGGFEPYSRRVFAIYRPEYDGVHSAHSIYFQILGEHGFVGFILFVAFWIATWRLGSRLIQETRDRPDEQWAHWLGRMVQVGMVGYFVGGAFLNLAYFDLPYYMMVMLAVAHYAVKRARDAAPVATSDKDHWATTDSEQAEPEPAPASAASFRRG